MPTRTRLPAPAVPGLELLSHLSATESAAPPLLFIHGAYCDAQIWNIFFLPYLARHGFDAYALSLRGHGASDGQPLLFMASVEDFTTDVVRTARQIGEHHGCPPILIGHSMGAAVVATAATRQPLSGLVLVAPVPLLGLAAVAGKLGAVDPTYFWHAQHLRRQQTPSESLLHFGRFFFSEETPREALAGMADHWQEESMRAIIDLMQPVHAYGRASPDLPLWVIGGSRDPLFTPADVQQVAHRYWSKATVFPDLGHLLMLDAGWERVAAWLAEEFRQLADGPASGDETAAQQA